MGKTNFTFVRPFMVLFAMLLLGFQSLRAQVDIECETIIANNATYTLANCSEDFDFFYSFNLGGPDCDVSDFDDEQVVVVSSNLPGDISFDFNRFEDTGDDGIFIEYVLSGVDADDAGTYTVELAYDDDDDNEVDAEEPNVSVKITIVAQQPVTDYRNLSCTGTVNITLDEDCTRTITASQVLNGALVCDDDFEVHVVKVINGRSFVNEEGQVTYGCGDYIYRVYRNGAI
ncbi:MAG: hypothetical protein ACK4TA_20345, partial [Saprospiraceae bacterium]